MAYQNDELVGLEMLRGEEALLPKRWMFLVCNVAYLDQRRWCDNQVCWNLEPTCIVRTPSTQFGVQLLRECHLGVRLIGEELHILRPVLRQGDAVISGDFLLALQLRVQ